MAGAQVNTAVDQQEAAKKEALLLFSFVWVTAKLEKGIPLERWRNELRRSRRSGAILASSTFAR